MGAGTAAALVTVLAWACSAAMADEGPSPAVTRGLHSGPLTSRSQLAEVPMTVRSRDRFRAASEVRVRRRRAWMRGRHLRETVEGNEPPHAVVSHST
jgi:Spy/CpxP family protein refolding chaperone